jgi:hypothetical protein
VGETRNNSETIAKYARLSPGNGIFGEWQSTLIEEKTLGVAPTLMITPFQNADSGVGDKKGHSSSGKRIDRHVLQIESQVNCKPEHSEEFKVSDDG